MFQVLTPPRYQNPPSPSGPAGAQPFAKPLTGVSGQVDHHHVAVFAHMNGQLILCTSGQLWVTIENDRVDHVLAASQWLFVASAGRVVIGGKGCYSI
jgi:hypothetical protein